LMAFGHRYLYLVACLWLLFWYHNTCGAAWYSICVKDVYAFAEFGGLPL
jgi:hypothetical protein